MMEYLKRKLTKVSADDAVTSFPRYYEENGKIIKECAGGEKWVIRLDSNYNEVLVERIA